MGTEKTGAKTGWTNTCRLVRLNRWDKSKKYHALIHEMEGVVTTSISLFIKWYVMSSKCLVGIACTLCYYLNYSPLWAVL
jgi:hypothetical protein